ncbi:MAG: DUF423 domain-containing protein [Nitrospira sp.]|nr:DUF423 domain-containing protein [Nitrospira sp.]MDH4237703.1 DUF423 domain-containing protein [Nitrospira sp.]MDH5253524.1 DUF423 domain-containing protein [Nitrospira sp.]MDH5625496.1 DUF423 domain-containing protein [Nitrospira sp.]
MDANASSRRVIAIGCVLAGVGVAAGAFGAHMLKTILEPPMLAAYDTATRYQMYHAFGMVLVGIAMRVYGDRRLAIAGWLFATGIMLFCGSLYGIALAGLKWLGPITPLGGLTFIIGWGIFGWRVWQGVSHGEKS